MSRILYIVRYGDSQRGFVAFTKAYTDISVRHYGMQQVRHESSYSTGGGKRPAQDIVRWCYNWNSDAGSPRLESDCFFGHFCSRCGLKKGLCHFLDGSFGTVNDRYMPRVLLP